MTPVEQNVFGEGKGNCWAACIASLLDLPITEVPNFCGEPERNPNWFSDTDKWLKQRGFRVIDFQGASGIAMEEGAYAIANGKSPRGDFFHVVVMTVQDGQFVVAHDPHPSGAGLDGPFKNVSVIVKA
jgi:hypothetical protein